MRVTTALNGRKPSEIAESAKRADRLGFDIVSSSETNHNPFLPLAIAAEHTERVTMRTSIALAFARSPMDMAYIAWDLADLSQGRFTLGLGSQVKGHIVRRFGMNWSAPAPKMREYIKALRHIWNAWQTKGKVEYYSDNYNFNLMPPFFTPEPIDNPDIKVYISAVNTNMLGVAGEVCDGVLVHGFSTHKYTQESILPRIAKGAARVGRTLEDLDISTGGFIVTGRDEEELEAQRQITKRRISFYASTRSYLPVMSAHGWDDTAAKLYRMSIDGKWAEMPGLITDDMLEAFSVIGTHDEIVPRLKATYSGYASSIGFDIPTPTPADEDRLKGMIEELQKP
ncbi:MAG: TIGR03617 family F420-dependent LLM class oxidoreductase [SAR202 cluster bacterium]|jgi:probable F420-dependent oxidoreductase|nr:TIGR03617 family F420-dependent LLM class oxidoreductase [SAR202 cluster bacterium]MDP6300266.1 TIGR03617 family F420-dependent LLM class oxidoreductase [SAR202 cluster bacterium]MDP7104468.1 TIGR03617 family F420-dependent LLM class oxidoreductase [SAR202 cluster bacterium]MDP7225984.1 TIGR03617 family F420-dependent LLM class oxidoreductase [SAR202 cluster bacterium]MDP7414875.1 TIGR03617 family F420-dependent LLM class oxidoreductase [SAR202 cluster bacterium]|tara:strand:- start:251 stop:1270 length:1020 start_codon:yes stop_codon:yes gene_type:complete